MKIKKERAINRVIVLIIGVLMLFLSFNKASASSVTVLPGNGGTLPLVNHLLIHQNDNALKSIDTNANERAKVTDVNNSRKRVTLKKVTDKDKITVTYGKVGTYEGQTVTAKMIVSHLKLHNDSHQPLFGLTHDDASFDFGPGFSSGINSINNIARFNVSFEFFDTSGNQLDINHSFLTVSSLDGPVENKTTGFEYTAFLNSGKIYTVENSIVRQVMDPLDGSRSVMAGQTNRPSNWPYFSASGATFEVYGKSLDFIYGSTRASLTNNDWVTPMFALSTVTLGKPEINEPKLTTDSDVVKAGDKITYDLKQPVNTLNEDLLNKYNNWTETLQLPKDSEYQSATLTDDNGKALAATDYKVVYDKVKNTVTYTLSKSGINKMKFNGEDYHFQTKVKTSKTITDQTKLNVTGITTIDGQTKKTTNNKVIVSNKRTITVHHYMTDSKDLVVNDQKVELGYGKNYQLKPLSYKPVGYTYNKKFDVNTSGVLTDKIKEAIFYYDADPFYIHVNYLLENGQPLDKLNILGLYGDTYQTEASDYDDLYTLVTEKMPKNINGDVTEKPIFVNYYYRPTTGKWVDVGDEGGILTRTDYKGNVRSISQNYDNKTGYSVKYDLDSPQVAITVGNDKSAKKDKDKVTMYGTQYTYNPNKAEKIVFDIDKLGNVKVHRTNGNKTTWTKFNKVGKIETTTSIINGDKTTSSQKDVIDGKKSVTTNQEFTQDLGDGYKITAQRNIDLNAKLKKSSNPLVNVKDPGDDYGDEIIVKDDDGQETEPSKDQATSKKTQLLDTLTTNKPTMKLNNKTVKNDSKNSDSSFNEGAPITEPKTDSDVNTTPYNNPDDLQTPAEASATTNVQITKDNKPVYDDTIKNGKEQTLYQTSKNAPKAVEIQAGADENGFYADKFNGDNETPQAYTMGPGYKWEAPKNNLNSSPISADKGVDVPTPVGPVRLPKTGVVNTAILTVLGIVILISALIFTRRKKRGVR